MSVRPRVIVASPAADERASLAEWLIAENYEPVLVGDAAAASAEITGRPALALIVDYGLTLRTDLHGVWRTRYPQTPPVVLSARDPAAQARTESLNAIFIERPVDRLILLCMVLMAILEGRPERRSPRKPSNLTARINGIPSRIVDLSLDGLRIELPRDQKMPPPVFRVSVPSVNVTLNVRRMWTSAPELDRATVLLCGGALTQNPTRAAQVWYSLVETLPARSAGLAQGR
jgi:hypothetical protein